MVKKVLSIILIILTSVGISFAQSDCFDGATDIGTCGYFFGGNNAGFGNCPGDKCGCVGGGSNPSNLDDDCSTVYPGGNCGSDFAGSVENSMFWKFRPTESCDYELCITADNCCCASGPGPDFMQVWIGQQDTTTGLISAYHVNDNSNTSITGGNVICYTFTVDMNLGDLVIMTDGNAGSECDIYLDINQVNCSDTCPVAVIDPPMSIKILKFTVKNKKTYNLINWKAQTNNSLYVDLMRSNDGINFETIKSINSNEKTTTQSYNDFNFKDGYNYYKLAEYDENKTVTYSKIISSYNSIENIEKIPESWWALNGTKIKDIENHKGSYIIKYKSGKSEILIK